MLVQHHGVEPVVVGPHHLIEEVRVDVGPRLAPRGGIAQVVLDLEVHQCRVP